MASIKPSICVFEIRGWANVSSRGRVAAETTDHWHWRWPGAGSTNKVDQDKSVGQNSELFLVPNCLLSLGPTSAAWKWTENVIWCIYCIPKTSVCVKPGRYNPVCGATRRNAMHQPSAGWKEYLCTEQRPRPWPGLAGGDTSEDKRGVHRVLGRGRVSPCLRVRCIHTTRPSPASGGGEI